MFEPLPATVRIQLVPFVLRGLVRPKNTVEECLHLGVRGEQDRSSVRSALGHMLLYLQHGARLMVVT